jgi:hypothetical protein
MYRTDHSSKAAGSSWSPHPTPLHTLALEVLSSLLDDIVKYPRGSLATEAQLDRDPATGIAYRIAFW